LAEIPPVLSKNNWGLAANRIDLALNLGRANLSRAANRTRPCITEPSRGCIKTARTQRGLASADMSEMTGLTISAFKSRARR
jgi:hypothetical protein